jgi:hypothetical protein
VDLDRHSLTLAVVAGLVLTLRAASVGFFYGAGKPEIVLYVIALIGFGLASVLASLVLLPGVVSRIGPHRWREPATIFQLAVAAFALAVIATAVQFVEVSIRQFGDRTPFGG